MTQQLIKRLIGFSIVILLLGLAACTPPTTEPIPVRETPTTESESETEGGSEEIQADCFQSATAFAWLDENGLLGPRVQLLPHQFYIADEVAQRPAPRSLARH